MNKALILITLLISIHRFPQAQTLTNAGFVPGGIAIVEIKSNDRPKAFYKQNRVMVIGEPGVWNAIIGIPLSTKPGIQKLKVSEIKGEVIYNFKVTEKQYETQHITITDKRKVNPTPLDMEKINKETKLIKQAKAVWSEIDSLSLDLALPVNGPYSSPFGLRRFFNEQPRCPHSGLDIAADEGTPILAAASGQIVNTGDYFFNGNTVFIDHGQGMITMYCHMNSITVKEDQKVNKGEVIGAVGMTGRVTGAHLHWSVIMNKTMTNPELFIEQSANERE